MSGKDDDAIFVLGYGPVTEVRVADGPAIPADLSFPEDLPESITFSCDHTPYDPSAPDSIGPKCAGHVWKTAYASPYHEQLGIGTTECTKCKGRWVLEMWYGSIDGSKCYADIQYPDGSIERGSLVYESKGAIL